MTVNIWIKDDAGYLAWCAANPGAFVANVKKHRKLRRILPSFLKIHSVEHELESQYDPPNWTEEGYAKVTSDNIGRPRTLATGTRLCSNRRSSV